MRYLYVVLCNDSCSLYIYIYIYIYIFLTVFLDVQYILPRVRCINSNREIIKKIIETFALSWRFVTFYPLKRIWLNFRIISAKRTLNNPSFFYVTAFILQNELDVQSQKNKDTHFCGKRLQLKCEYTQVQGSESLLAVSYSVSILQNLYFLQPIYFIHCKPFNVDQTL